MSGRPLLDNRSDAALFVDREVELERIHRALDSGLNCLVTGERGMGKTSLLRAALYRERNDPDSRHHLLYVRGAGAADVVALLTRVGNSVLADAGADEVVAHDVDQLLTLIDHGIRKRPRDAGLPVVVLDDPPPAAGHTLFGSLRDELWTLGMRWLVALPTDDATTLLRPPADAFFEVRLDLPPLDNTSSAGLLNRRLGGASGDIVQQVTGLARGNPRRLLDLARGMHDGTSGWLDMSAAITLQQQALARLGRPAHLLAAELEALGGASASDERLLDRMGWTRSRVVQVLRELEEAGLARSQAVRTGKGGRPRMVYTLVPATIFASEQMERER